jgi:hypothetical protein
MTCKLPLASESQEGLRRPTTRSSPSCSADHSAIPGSRPGRSAPFTLCQFRVFDRVASVSEISNAEKPVAFPLQEHEVRRRARCIAWIMHNRRWPALERADDRFKSGVTPATIEPFLPEAMIDQIADVPDVITTDSKVARWLDGIGPPRPA